MVRVSYLYGRAQRQVEEAWRAGLGPDTPLHGRPYLQEYGITTDVAVAPAADAVRRLPTHLATPMWHARAAVPVWRSRHADVIFTWLGLVPGLLRGGPWPRSFARLVLFSVGWQTILFRHGGSRSRLWRHALQAADAVVCLAASQRRALAERGADPERLRVVRFGVDAEFFRPSPLSANGYVLAVGRDLGRDYATLLAAARGLDAPFVIVASPQNLGRPDTIPPNVSLRLDVSYTELRELYERAACVVVPVHPDGYPYGSDCSGQTVLLDAMATGRPVVISERAWLEDYVRDGETALIVPPRDPNALRAALAGLLDDQQRAVAIGASGRQAVEDGLTSRHFAAGLASVFRTAAGRTEPHE